MDKKPRLDSDPLEWIREPDEKTELNHKKGSELEQSKSKRKKEVS